MLSPGQPTSPMTERILPLPDAFASCPIDGNVLDYYAGTFESVYVFLHPFIQPLSCGPAPFDWAEVCWSISS